VKKYKLLIIEDSVTLNNMLKRALKSITTEIVQSFTLQEAADIIEDEDFDYILLDLILPDGEGEELVEMVPKHIRNKIIVLTADDDIEKRSYLFDLGVLDYFSKLNPIHLIISDIKKLFSSIEVNKNMNVLVIDDSRFIRRKIKNVLSPRKYNLFLSESGEDGLEVLQKENIHLILLDVELDGMNGMEFLEIIRKEQKYAAIPIIAISGNDSPHIVARLLKHGATDFIKKPFIVEQLLLKCDLHIKNYQNVQLLEEKTEELKKAEEVKSRFLANMSHEIRTPLNAIVGFIDLLKHKNLDEESAKYIDTISEASKTLMGVLNDILDFSKMEAGLLRLEKVEFSPLKKFQSIIDLFKVQAGKKNITIKENFINIPKYVKSDPVRLKQVLLNLLSNAIKFTPEHKNIYVTIEYKDNRLYFSIKDEGIGIPEDKVEKIFKPFTQADDSTTRKFGGTGLGLSISYEIVKLLGGELKVKSEENKGSEFYFDIPVEVVEHKSEEHTVSTHPLRGKVLVVEDNRANQLFIQVLLKKLHLDYKIANNGQEAVDIFKKEKFDLILMDENMPIMSGIEATKEIRKIQKEHIPIVAVTANALPEDKERFKEAGFDEYISKPVDITLLISIMNKYL
jgi:signal transduction histidine kinase